MWIVKVSSAYHLSYDFLDEIEFDDVNIDSFCCTDMEWIEIWIS